LLGVVRTLARCYDSEEMRKEEKEKRFAYLINRSRGRKREIDMSTGST